MTATHFRITLGDPAAPSAFFSGSQARIELNGVDISESVGQCRVVIDPSEVVRVELELAATSLTIEGHAAPDFEVRLFGESPGELPEPLALADGGSVTFRRGGE